MNKNQMQEHMRGWVALLKCGFSDGEIQSLYRIHRTLRTWAEHECNGTIQRDGDDGEGRPFWYNVNTGHKLGPVADRERGALRRLQKIMESHPGYAFYHQGDPRGCALYIIRPGDVRDGASVGSCYTNGIAVCY